MLPLYTHSTHAEQSTVLERLPLPPPPTASSLPLVQASIPIHRLCLRLRLRLLGHIILHSTLSSFGIWLHQPWTQRAADCRDADKMAILVDGHQKHTLRLLRQVTMSTAHAKEAMLMYRRHRKIQLHLRELPRHTNFPRLSNNKATN
jgi:hypothetical protein